MADALDVDGLLLDIDGVLATSWEPLPGSIEAIERLRRADVPFRLITNTTTQSREHLAHTLRDAGFDVTAEEIITAVVATASHLRAAHPDARVLVLTDGDPRPDLDGIDVVPIDADADVVVVGGACDAFTYPALNHLFRLLMGGAALVGMHRNLYWRTARGLELDGGAYIAGLEEATGIMATICGKPAAAYFDAALALLGVAPERAAMVGDDIVNDVVGAQAAGMTGVLVRTGKFQDGDLEKGTPDLVLGALADLLDALGI